MEEESRSIEIRISDLVAILKRCWWQMAIVLLVTFIGVFVYTNVTHEDEYTATAEIWALPNSQSSTGNVNTSDVSIGTNLINDFTQLIVSKGVLEPVLKAEKLTDILTIDQLAGMITIDHTTGTRVMNISVTAKDPKRAADITNTLVAVFCQRVNSTNEEGEKSLVQVWSTAEEPELPSNPVSTLKLLLIALVAAIVVYGIHLVVFLLDDKVNGAEDVERYLGVSVLGMIPNRRDVIRRRSKNGYYYSYGSNHSGGNPAGGKRAPTGK